jgi:hypothetical protein
MIHLIILLTIFTILIYLNLNKISRIYNLYKIFKNTVDPENKKNCFTIFYDIFSITYKLFFSSSLNTFNNKHIKIPYDFRDKKYIYLLKLPRGVIPIDTIVDENDNNIFEIIYPYLGPNLDCHGSNIFPKDFGIKKIIIKDINNKEYIFEENDTIKVC